MDRLDRISLWVILILIISSSVLIRQHRGETKSGRGGQPRAAAGVFAALPGEFDHNVKGIKNLIEANSLGKAERLVQELLRQYPYEGEPRMLMGDIYVRKQESVRAVLEYKEAVDLNPDYLDKKTPLFQGKKIKVAVKEALDDVEKRLKADPADESVRRDRKVIYYLQRRIAGSCG